MKQQTLEETFLKSSKKNKSKTQNEQNNQQNIKVQQKPQQKQKSHPAKPSKNKKQVPKVIQVKKTKIISKKDENSQNKKANGQKNQKKTFIAKKGKAKEYIEKVKKQKEVFHSKILKGKKSVISTPIEEKKEQIVQIPDTQHKKSKRKSTQKEQKLLVEQVVKQVQKQEIEQKNMIQDQANVVRQGEEKKQVKEQKSENKKIESQPKQGMSKKRGGRWRKKESDVIEQKKQQQVVVQQKEPEIRPEMKSQNNQIAQENKMPLQEYKEKRTFSINLKGQSEGQIGFRRSSRRMKIQQQKDKARMQQQKNQQEQNNLLECPADKSEQIEVDASADKKQPSQQLKDEGRKRPGVKNRKRAHIRAKKVSKQQKQQSFQQEGIINDNEKINIDMIDEAKDIPNDGLESKDVVENGQIQQMKESSAVSGKKKLIKKPVPLLRQSLHFGNSNSALLSGYEKFAYEGTQQQGLFSCKPLIFDKFTDQEHYDSLVDEIKHYEKQTSPK